MECLREFVSFAVVLFQEKLQKKSKEIRYGTLFSFAFKEYLLNTSHSVIAGSMQNQNFTSYFIVFLSNMVSFIFGTGYIWGYHTPGSLAIFSVKFPYYGFQLSSTQFH